MNLDDPDDDVAAAVFDIAEALKAVVVGDEGERYNRP